MPPGIAVQDPFHRDYLYRIVTVNIGANPHTVDLRALINAMRPVYEGRLSYLVLTTDVDITFRLNAETADEMPLTSADGFTLPPNTGLALEILHFYHTGASSGAGAATVTIFAT